LVKQVFACERNEDDDGCARTEPPPGGHNEKCGNPFPDALIGKQSLQDETEGFGKGIIVHGNVVSIHFAFEEAGRAVVIPFESVPGDN